MARKWRDAVVSKCGDSFYMDGIYVNPPIRTHALFEFKTSEPTVLAFPITEADRLNGIEWHGIVEIPVSAYRYHDYDEKKWHGWFNGPPPRREAPNFLSELPPTLGSSISKVKGKWDLVGAFGKRPCYEIPKG
jgi:hypothetical protein